MKQSEHERVKDSLAQGLEYAKATEWKVVGQMVKAEAVEKQLEVLTNDGYDVQDILVVNNTVMVIASRINPEKISVEEEEEPTTELPVAEPELPVEGEDTNGPSQSV